jgi:hypothetical protein
VACQNRIVLARVGASEKSVLPRGYAPITGAELMKNAPSDFEGYINAVRILFML